MTHSEKTVHLLKKLKNELRVSARRVALELQFALTLFAAKAAHRRVIAISILLLLSARKCSIEENMKQSSTSGLERLYVN